MKLALFLVPLAVFAASPSGEAIFKKRCSACHEQTTPRIPPREALQKMPAARIQRALDSGAMMAVGFAMSRDEKIAVATYLGTNAPDAQPSPKAFCADRSVHLSADPKSSWVGFSPSSDNSRFQPAANLSIDQVRGLKLKWAFGFDGDVTAFAAPTVIDGQVFVGGASGLIHAMRADSGCLEWVFQANGPVRSAMISVPFNQQHALLFGDMTGWFYAVQAETGKLLWKMHADAHDSTRLTGAPVAHGGVVYVPISSWEETRAADLEYACCTFRGSVMALRISDGTQMWRTYMTDPAKETGKNASGISQYGPSGAGIWSSPTLDVKRGLLYVTTGDNYSSPATDRSDAVVALEMATGKIVWSKQVTAGDIFNGTCPGNHLNCPAEAGPDFDFGSPAILVNSPRGRELLLAGQKSGIVYAFDPAKRGEIVWQTRIGRGTTYGGVQWGMASDGQQVYASVSDFVGTRQTNPLDLRRFIIDPTQGGGVTALRIVDGTKVWRAAAPPCAKGAPDGCSPAQPGSVSAIPGVVFSTSMDGHLRAHSSEDGHVIWEFDTMRSFNTVNGVKATGGSMDGPGAVVANGMVFVNSGYPRNAGVAGNVLLAFGSD